MQINRSRGHEQQPSKSTLTIHQVQRVRQGPFNHHHHHPHHHHHHHLYHHHPQPHRSSSRSTQERPGSSTSNELSRDEVQYWFLTRKDLGRALPHPVIWTKSKKIAIFFLEKPSLRNSILSKHYHFTFKGSESIGTASITSKDSGKSNAVSLINYRAPRRPLNPKWGVC